MSASVGKQVASNKEKSNIKYQKSKTQSKNKRWESLRQAQGERKDYTVAKRYPG
jgi:hypothetical protein